MEGVDRLFQYLWGHWVALAGRGLVFVLVVAVVSLRGVGFFVFFLNLALWIVGSPDTKWAVNWDTPNHRQQPVNKAELEIYVPPIR